MKADLHLHTSYSDGNWTPSQLVAHAVEIGMTHIAVTDHDTVAGLDETFACAPSCLTVIPALEINTIWQDAFGVKHDVHVLGYFIDKENRELNDLLKRQQNARLQQVERLLAILVDDGIAIGMDDILHFANQSPIGKAHITQAIVKAGGARDVMEAYTRFFDRHSKYYVARASASPFEAVEAIAGAGGVTSLAHPAYGEDLSRLIEELAETGLDGIEAYHSVHDRNAIDANVELARRLNLIVTGGSDCHGPFEEHASLMGTVQLPLDIVPELCRRHASLTR